MKKEFLKKSIGEPHYTTGLGMIFYGTDVTLCLHFAMQDGQDKKEWKENHTTKVAKIPKTKRHKYEMNQKNNT